MLPSAEQTLIQELQVVLGDLVTSTVRGVGPNRTVETVAYDVLSPHSFSGVLVGRFQRTGQSLRHDLNRIDGGGISNLDRPPNLVVRVVGRCDMTEEAHVEAFFQAISINIFAAGLELPRLERILTRLHEDLLAFGDHPVASSPF